MDFFRLPFGTKTGRVKKNPIELQTFNNCATTPFWASIPSPALTSHSWGTDFLPVFFPPFTPVAPNRVLPAGPNPGDVDFFNHLIVELGVLAPEKKNRHENNEEYPVAQWTLQLQFAICTLGGKNVGACWRVGGVMNEIGRHKSN